MADENEFSIDEVEDVDVVEDFDMPFTMTKRKRKDIVQKRQIRNRTNTTTAFLISQCLTHQSTSDRYGYYLYVFTFIL